MTKKQRTILFLFCFLLFLIFAPLVVLYSQGYRFDFNSKKIVKTGGFYFKVWPKSVRIYLNGKFKKKTDFLFGSTLIENLLPKKYEIEIKKEGFHPWKKNLEVKEKLVTEAKNIFLIPKNPKFNLLTKNVASFWPSPDGKKIALLKETQEKDWNIVLFDLEKNTETKLFEKKDFKEDKKTEINFLDLKFSPDSKKILFKIKLGQEEKYFISEIEKLPLTLISLEFLGNDLKNISFNLKNEDKIFFLDSNILFEANFKNKTKSKVLEDVIGFDVGEKNIYFLSTKGFLFKADFSGFLEERLNLKPLNLRKEAKYQLVIEGNNIFLLEDETFYIWDRNLKEFKKILTRVKKFEISPDYKKMYLATNHEIWVLFLEKISDQPQREIGEKVFLTRFSKEIKNIFWYTSHYLIFNLEGKIKIAEIDDRDRINIVDLIEFKKPKIFFNSNNKVLYLLSERNFFASENLQK